MNKRSVNKIYYRIDSIAKQGSIGKMEYSKYIDTLVSEGRFAEFQIVLERKYGIDTSSIPNVEEVKKRTFDIIRFQTNSKFQEGIKKICDDNGVYQQGQDIYKSGLNIGYIIESNIPNGVEVTTFSIYNGSTFSYPEINGDEVVQSSLLSIYKNSIQFLLVHVPTTSTTTTTTTLSPTTTTSTTTTTTTLLPTTTTSTTTTTTTLLPTTTTTSTTTSTTTDFITTSTTTTTTTIVGPSGSLLFDGITHQYLNITNSTDFNVGTNDFTVEWFQKQELGDDYPRAWTIGGFPSVFGTSVENGNFFMWIGGSETNFTMNAWQDLWIHLAVCRYGGTVSIYQNGLLIGSYVETTNITSSDDLLIGIDPVYTDVAKFKGRISNFHFVNGTSLYTDTFMVPTPPLSPVSNTKLLLLSSTPETYIDDSSGTGKVITNVLGVTWSLG